MAESTIENAGRDNIGAGMPVLDENNPDSLIIQAAFKAGFNADERRHFLVQVRARYLRSLQKDPVRTGMYKGPLGSFGSVSEIPKDKEYDDRLEEAIRAQLQDMGKPVEEKDDPVYNSPFIRSCASVLHFDPNATQRFAGNVVERKRRNPQLSTREAALLELKEMGIAATIDEETGNLIK